MSSTACPTACPACSTTWPTCSTACPTRSPGRPSPDREGCSVAATRAHLLRPHRRYARVLALASTLLAQVDDAPHTGTGFNPSGVDTADSTHATGEEPGERRPSLPHRVPGAARGVLGAVLGPRRIPAGPPRRPPGRRPDGRLPARGRGGPARPRGHLGRCPPAAAQLRRPARRAPARAVPPAVPVAARRHRAGGPDRVARRTAPARPGRRVPARGRADHRRPRLRRRGL